jgi:hypothetical protein
MARGILPSQAARALQALRKNRAGGRPRSTKKRCPCGVMTLKRAQARGREPAHEPGCDFAPIR